VEHVRGVRWMGWLFIVGSACFALGVPLSLALPSDPQVAGAVYFVGSVFFTSAASVQMWLSRRALPSMASMRPLRRLWHLLGIADPGWSSAWIQWLGTLAFNVTTWRSLVTAVGEDPTSATLVWRPDAVGSVLFLVSSGIAMTPAVRHFRHAHVRDRSWAIAALNLVGSIFFGLSAVGAYTLPSSGDLVSLAWANAGTLLGALCFLAGAWLVLPRRRG